MRRREGGGLGQLGQLTFVGPQKPRPERAAPNSSPDSDAFSFQKAIKLGTVGLKVLCTGEAGGAAAGMKCKALRECQPARPRVRREKVLYIAKS